MPARRRDDLDRDLTEEQIHARDLFWQFAQEQIAPGARLRDQEQRTSEDVISKVAEQGYLGAVIPGEYGGAAMDMVTFGVLNSEIGRACASVRVLLNVQAMVAHAIAKCGDDRQKAHWLPRLASGDMIAAFALSEPNIGCDAKSIETVAVASGDHYVLNGKKKWTSYGQVADLYLVFAQCDGQHTALLVQRDAPGLNVAPLQGMLGTRASMLAELTFGDCRVPRTAVLGRPGFGMHAVGATALDLGRYSVAWGCLGLAQACLQASAKYARTRKQFGKRLQSFQLVKRLLAKMYADICAVSALCLRAGQLRDAGDPDSIIQSCLAKYFASTACARIASDAVQLHGAVGCCDESPVERHYRDAKVTEIIEGSTQMQQLMIANHVATSVA